MSGQATDGAPQEAGGSQVAPVSVRGEEGRGEIGEGGKGKESVRLCYKGS